MAESLAVNVGIILLATVGIYIGSGWLEQSSDTLSSYYGLPLVVQGAIVAAVGSSFPELASVVFSALSGSFGLGVGAIVGSAIFNILVIPALSGIVTHDDIESSRTLVYKEAQFYMIAVSVVVITFAMAVIYFPNGAPLTGRVTRPLAVMPLALYGLYIFIQYADTADYEAEPVTDVNVLRQWGTLVAGLIVILVSVEQLVHAVKFVGNVYGAPDFLWGITVLAAATSLPDTLVSVRAAKDGRGVTSLANVLGSNTFDLLVAIPIGVLIVGAAPINFAIAVPTMGFLTLATVLLFTVLRTDLSLTDGEAYGLLVAYIGFVLWMIAETADLTNFIPGA
ncbi:Ca2+/Na+ antiporter [Halogeometricum borinquense DSM 11551]|uniref:Ca2+/Na+ antiporter n=1 Tax=Halogeometricum borinquense (strain ATCC 700274 / DSM 11551 / JCM 10706 / KCTC 4070 / PR3) TaxID=469382 RepID=E4NV07_HALBP|nr:sodium:calcium antiporter [Halogeometricum borinquense]ADQ68996.1 Ca2+/Na+ antiporter [Halogeometricum borinquense DSM 11551]ELY29180.1 Ca2+/Na+ antiporter [Halogeometricum borinquense DSM 11551]